MIKKDVIDEDLAELAELLQKSLKSTTEFVDQAGDYIINSGGKRLRPALFFLAAHGGKNFSRARALPLAAALELIHTASLVHDDVIDEADLRRGVPTANAKWGRRVAILTGDYIFASAFRLVSNGGYDDFVSSRLSDLVANLSVGEIIEVRGAYSATRDINDYFDRIQKKTADFLEICCELGGVIGGMSGHDAKSLAAYGHNIGMAFQIIDDILDLAETDEQVGKPVGNDILQGVTTLPVIRALNVSPKAVELEAILRNAAMTRDDAKRAVNIVRETDGMDFARQYADKYINDAKATLPDVLPSDVREAFVEAANFIAERNY